MDGVKRSCLEVIGQRNVNMAKIRQIFPQIFLPFWTPLLISRLKSMLTTYIYLAVSNDIKAFKKDEVLFIPENLNYDSLSGLSNEIKSKLKKN